MRKATAVIGGILSVLVTLALTLANWTRAYVTSDQVRDEALEEFRQRNAQELIKQYDADIAEKQSATRRKLLGHWEYLAGDKEAEVSGTVTIRVDGTVTYSGTRSAGGKSKSFAGEGTWQITVASRSIAYFELVPKGPTGLDGTPAGTRKYDLVELQDPKGAWGLAIHQRDGRFTESVMLYPGREKK